MNAILFRAAFPHLPMPAYLEGSAATIQGGTASRSAHSSQQGDGTHILALPVEPLSVARPSHASDGGKIVGLDYIYYWLNDNKIQEFAAHFITGKSVDEILDQDLSSLNLDHNLTPQALVQVIHFLETLQPIDSKIMESTYLGDKGHWLMSINGIRYHLWHRMRTLEVSAGISAGHDGRTLELPRPQPSGTLVGTALYGPPALAFKPDIGGATVFRHQKEAANYQRLYDRWYITDFVHQRVQQERFQGWFCNPGTDTFKPMLRALLHDLRGQVLAGHYAGGDGIPHSWPFDNVDLFDPLLVTDSPQAPLAHYLAVDPIYTPMLLQPWANLRNPLRQPLLDAVDPIRIGMTLEPQRASRPSNAFPDYAEMVSGGLGRMVLNTRVVDRDVVGFDEVSEWDAREWGSAERRGRALEEEVAAFWRWEQERHDTRMASALETEAEKRLGLLCAGDDVGEDGMITLPGPPLPLAPSLSTPPVIAPEFLPAEATAANAANAAATEATATNAAANIAAAKDAARARFAAHAADLDDLETAFFGSSAVLGVRAERRGRRERVERVRGEWRERW